MPYLGLRGNKLLAAVTCSAGMGFILFGRRHPGGFLVSLRLNSDISKATIME
jgi:hypothetical protein